MKLKFPRPGLQLKIVAWSFIPAAIILLGIGLFSFLLFRAVIESLMIENNRARTELMAEQIGGELATLADQLKNVARTPDLLGEDVSSPRAALHQLASGLETFDGGVVVLNRQGIVVASEPARQGSPQEDWSDRPYFRQIVYSPGTILSDIHSDSPREALVVSLAVPITGVDGQFLGAVAGMLRVDSSGTSSLNRRLAAFRTWPFGEGQHLVSSGPLKSTFLVDRNGRIVFHTEASLVAEDASSSSAVQAVLAGRRGPISTSEYRDRDVVSYFAPVPNTGWGFLVEQQRSAVLNFYQRYFQLESLLYAFALIVPAGLVAFGVRHITGPIRQVTAASRQIAAGDLQQVIDVRTGDELEDLANQFNRMSAQLRESYDALKEREERLALVIRATNDGILDWDLRTNQVYFSPRWKEMLGYADDEIGNTFDDWRRLLHPDDSERALALIQDYRQGKTPSYELEHRSKAKDGSFRWVLARGVVLRDESGQAYRMVGSNTDITDRKKIEEALEKRLAFERLITGISTEFINLAPDEIDAGIQGALQSIGEFAHVDRSSVFLISSDGATMDKTHEWCAAGIESFIADLKGIPLETFPWLIEQLKRLEVVHVPSLSTLPAEAGAEKQEFEQQRIQSLIIVPMVYRGTLVGFLGLESVLTEKAWSDETFALLRIVGEIFANALEHKRAQALEAGQRQFLELLATGGDFSTTLHALVRIVEEQWRGMLGLILLLDEDGKHLHIGAAVSLPQDYLDSIEGLEIGPMVGSCGTACYRRERVIVQDILTDPRWDGLRSLAVQYGLRACWSEPVIASNSQVVGTFAMYYRQPRAPTQDELRTIATAAHLVGIAIEHQRAQEALRQSEMRLRAIFEGAPIGIHVTEWEAKATDWRKHTIKSNRAYQQILGFTGEELATLRLEAFTHPEDAVQDRSLYQELLDGKRDGYQLEKRYIAKDGKPFWGRYSASIVRDAEARPQLMIGMMENIQEQKQAQQALQVAYQTLEGRVEERTRELATVNAIASVVNRSLDLHEIMSEALERTMQVVGMEAGAAYCLQEEDRTLGMMAQRGLSDEFVHFTSRLPLETALAGKTLAGERPVIWNALTDYPEGELKSYLLKEGLASVVGVPLLAKGKLVGGLVISTRTPRELNPEESSLVYSIGQQVGLAVENARLYQQAQRIATMAERSRLARELHDSVTQSLYSVMLHAEAAARSLADKETAEAGDYLKELRDTAQGALREMRLLIFELRPPALEKSGLLSALRTRLNAVEGRGGIKAELQVNNERMIEELPFSLREELYHIVQEALNNVIRHARAQSVRVGIEFGDKTIDLEVYDDGIGFDPANASEGSGLGLRGVRERVQRIGGAMEIQSAPGKGTRVIVHAPRPRGDQRLIGGEK